MATVHTKIKLNNGVEIPIIGSGAYAPPDAEAQGRVKDWIGGALKNGYRHIDTAQGYGTEAAVGEAIRASGIPREEIFVTTKLPWNHQSRVRESFDDSLKNLAIGHIDLYLLHWPQAIVYEEGNSAPRNADGTFKTTDKFNFSQAWADIEKLLDTGKVRAIGVSNFSIKK
jgi:glycerol 2-dehydrogenase (NADP+)